MVSDFWSELLASVGSLFKSLTVGRQQREFIFVDPPDLASASDQTILDFVGTADPPATPAPPMWVQAKAQLASLQKSDPNFAEPTFLTQASKTYSAAFAAEGAMNPDAIASIVTPAFLDRFRRHVTDWRNGGLTRVVSDVHIDPPTTLKVTIGGETQAITVRFTGSAKRFTRDDMTNLVTDGSAQAQSFSEFATFVRPAGSSTPKSVTTGGSIDCPSCGAPAEEGAIKCAFCGASLTGTGGSWLLDKISASAYT